MHVSCGMHACMYVYMYVYMCACVYVCVYVSMYVHVRVYQSHARTCAPPHHSLHPQMHRAKHRVIAGSKRTVAKHHQVELLPTIFQSIDTLLQCAAAQGYILEKDPALLDLRGHVAAFNRSRGNELDKHLLAAQVPHTSSSTHLPRCATQNTSIPGRSCNISPSILFLRKAGMYSLRCTRASHWTT